MRLLEDAALRTRQLGDPDADGWKENHDPRRFLTAFRYLSARVVATLIGATVPALVFCVAVQRSLIALSSASGLKG